MRISTSSVFIFIRSALLLSVLSITTPLAAQWQQTANLNGGTVLSLTAVQNTLFAGTSGTGVYRSTSNGQSWQTANTGLPTAGLAINCFLLVGSTLYAGTNLGSLVAQTTSLYSTTNLGGSWDSFPSVVLAVVNSAVLFESSFDNVCVGGFPFNGGSIVSFSTSSPSSTDFDIGAPLGTLTTSMTRQTSFLFACYNGAVNRADYTQRNAFGQLDFTALTNGLPASSIPSPVASFGGTLFLGTGSAGNGVYRSTNNGALWIAASTGLPDGVAATCFTSDGTRVFVGTQNSGVYRSSNAGVSWEQVDSGLPINSAVSALTVKGDTLYAGVGNKVWFARIPALITVPVELTAFSARATATGVDLLWRTASEKNNAGFEVERTLASNSTAWEKIGFVAGNGTTTEAKAYQFTDAARPNRTLSYRLKQIDFDGKFTLSPSLLVAAGVPASFDLMQNYPNPFNPSTVISYQLATDSEVSLKVFDMLGKEVQTLVSARQEAGQYSAVFDASRLASGIYFYRLVTSASSGALSGSPGAQRTFSATKKMLLVR